MTRRVVLAGLTVVFLAGAGVSPAPAQTDQFAFVPAGGRTLLLRGIAGARSRADVIGLLSARRSAAEWKTVLRGRPPVLPAAGSLTDPQLATLAAYLALAAPIRDSDAPRDLDPAAWGRALPPDGRDLVLNKCQLCHIITVVVTQEKDARGWRGLLQGPNHTGILTAEAQRDMLGQYLEINAPIPIEKIPEPLRAGGASY